MKKNELREKSVKTLKALAMRLGVLRPTTSRKEDLIAEIVAAKRIHGLKAQGSRKSTRSKIPVKKHSESKKIADVPRSRRAPSKAAPHPVMPEVVHSNPEIVEHKFETPVHPAFSGEVSVYDQLGELPDSYGTGRLSLTARDPHWLYAYWDYTWEQIDQMRWAARDGGLKLRVYMGPNSQSPLQQEIALQREARNWFIPVGLANADYCAELGYYDSSGNFTARSRSQPAHTPPDRMSDQTSARFVTIPFRFRFRQLLELVKAHQRDGEELADVLCRLQCEGFRFPFEYGGEKDWTLEQDQLLTRLFGKGVLQLMRTGSLEVTQWLRPTSSGIP